MATARLGSRSDSSLGSRSDSSSSARSGPMKKRQKTTSDEDKKYIGYSNSQQRWIIIEPRHVRPDTYEFLNSGATSWVYVKRDGSKVVKIIRGSSFIPDEQFIAKAKKEVKYQKAAAEVGLAPQIYHHGFIKKENSFYDKNEPYYYIEMDNLSEATGWNPIFASQAPELFCKFIRDLVVKVGIINVEDPQLHFFYNGSELRMIDFDRCIECASVTGASATGASVTGASVTGASETEICIAAMAKALGINCSAKTGGKKSVKRKYTNKSKYNKKSKFKKTHIKKRKSRKYTSKKKKL